MAAEICLAVASVGKVKKDMFFGISGSLRVFPEAVSGVVGGNGRLHKEPEFNKAAA
jgi:hypothetical protein